MDRSRTPLKRFAVVLILGPWTALHAQGPMSSTKPPERAGEALAQPGGADAAGPISNLDVEKLFANTCGWCHHSGGREAGKGPQLMGTALTDDQITYRIKNGKPGFMPAFGSAFKDEDIRAIIKYIRGLQPQDSAKLGAQQ